MRARRESSVARTQHDGTRCIVTDSDGFARTAADGALAYETSTRQHIGSVSKVFGAVALLDAMRNADAQVDLGDFVSDYLPADWDLGPGTETITFDEVLGHRAGIAKTGDTLDALKAWFAKADCEGPVLSDSCARRGLPATTRTATPASCSCSTCSRASPIRAPSPTRPPTRTGSATSG